MARRLFVALLVLSFGSVTLAAIERATFILTSGERVSGTVVFHTNTRENLIDGDLNLGMAQGGEQQIHLNQVVVIEFLAGTPGQSELAALPEGSGQMLVMRNGETRYGQFVNMIAGETVRWKAEAGNTQEMPIRDVTRIYLNAENARHIFNYTPPPRGRFEGRGYEGRRGEGRGLARGRRFADEVEVPGTTPWVDAGLDVQRGELIAFSVRGQISIAQGASGKGPDGEVGRMSETYPLRTMALGGLIGRIGNGPPFAIGSNRNPIRMPASGRLRLGINDDGHGDNSGAFWVTMNQR